MIKGLDYKKVHRVTTFTIAKSEKCQYPHAIKLLHHIENCARTPMSYTTFVIDFRLLNSFRRLRRNLPPKIMMNLCVALGMTLIVFVCGAERINPKWFCKSTAVALNYLVLVSFSWMLAESVQLYLCFVKVMGSYVSKFMLKAGIASWGKL